MGLRGGGGEVWYTSSCVPCGGLAGAARATPIHVGPLWYGRCGRAGWWWWWWGGK